MIEVSLYELERQETILLSNFMKKSRPLVVNFGSCTWPPFMANISKFAAICEKFQDLADFVTIYIAEAHPADRGHFKAGADGGQFGQIDTATHTSLQDRINAALKLKEKAASFLEGCPIMVSTHNILHLYYFIAPITGSLTMSVDL